MRNARWLVLSVLALASFAALTPDVSAAQKLRRDPILKEMVKDSSQIIDATVQYVGKEEMKVKVEGALKGSVKGSLAIGSYYERIWKPLDDLRDTYKDGQRYIFFLKDSLVGNVPYSPTRRSIDLTVKDGMVMVCLLAPGFTEFQQAVPFELFQRYIHHLDLVTAGNAPDQAFVGELLEKLKEASTKPDAGVDQEIYLTMLLDFRQLDDEALIRTLLKSGNINVRYLAVQQSRNLPREKAVRISLDMLKDPRRLIQSLAAKNLEELMAFESIREMAAIVPSLENKPVERQAADPVGTLEPPRRAILRAIISFDSDEAMDVIEKTLLSRDVESFRIILDVFKEYEDETIHLTLLELMQDGNFLPLRVAILDYFNAIKSKEAIAHLKELYASEYAGDLIRKSIVEVLAAYKDQDVLDFFYKAMNDKSPQVRQAALKAIASLANPASIDILKENYPKEPDRLARGFYIDALAAIPDPRALQVLKDLYEIEKDAVMKRQLKEAIKSSKFLSQ